MPHLSPKSQVGAFRLIVDLERRSEEIEALIGRLKHDFVQDPAELETDELNSLAASMRRQLGAVTSQLRNLEKVVGVPRGTRRAAARQVRAAPQHLTLRGNSHTLPIPDVLGMLSTRGKTGTLWIKARRELFVLELLAGAVVHAVGYPPEQDSLLGSILVAQNKLSPEKLEQFLARYCREQGMIGEVLARAHLVSEDDLMDALEHQVKHLFKRLFGLESAVFCFVDGSVSDVELRVTLNTTQLLLEAARLRDEADRDARVDSIETAFEGNDLEPGDGDALTHPFHTVVGLRRPAIEAFRAHGVETVEDLRRTPLEDLAAIPGIGTKTLHRVRAYFDRVRRTGT